WVEGRELAKQERWQIGWAKPKLGKLESPMAQPGVEKDNGEEAEQRDDENGDENGDENDNAMRSNGGSEEE
ncbi:hypothetical protein PAXRUDRAFT_783522, partial [Paxillus rubicundulus Ve08.2h10]